MIHIDGNTYMDDKYQFYRLLTNGQYEPLDLVGELAASYAEYLKVIRFTGVTFSEQREAEILKAVESDNIIKAQQIILAGLKEQFDSDNPSSQGGNENG